MFKMMKIYDVQGGLTDISATKRSNESNRCCGYNLNTVPNDAIVVGGRHFWLFVVTGSPPYILYIVYIHTLYIMYVLFVYIQLHTCLAGSRNVKTTPANTYRQCALKH